MATTRDADGFCSKSTPEQDAAALAPFQARLGDTPEAVLEWIITFAQRDLSKVGPGERQDLGQDLRAIAALVCHPEARRGWRPKSRPVPEAELLELQAQLREGLQRFLAGGWVVPGSVILGQVTSPKTGRPRVRLSSVASAVDGGIVAATVELLSYAGDRLRVCPTRECGRVFLRYRKQVFCCTKHAQEARNTKHYRKRRAKALGKQEEKVKVNHRRRR